MQRLLLLCVLGLFLIGCGGAPATDTAADTPDDGPTSAPPVPGPSDEGSTTAVEPFGTVTLVNGERLDGAEYAGDNLALWFWAPW